jgi:hypothetical protein
MVTLSSKIILPSTNGYFVLSDRSCWKVVGFSKRWRTFSEWWNSVQLIAPECYECLPNDWYVGTQIEVHSKLDRLNVSEADASNQEILRQCTHLLVNSHTGKVLFAISMEPGECMLEVFHEGFKLGHNQGIAEGRLQGYQNAQALNPH